MRLSLLVAVVCGALLLAQYEADATVTVVRTVHDTRSFRIAGARIRRAVAVAENGVRSSRVKRQSPSPQCLAALGQAVQNTTFTSCEQVLQVIGNLSYLSHDQIEGFCHNHCPVVLNKFFSMIKRACPEQGYVPPEVCLL